MRWILLFLLLVKIVSEAYGATFTVTTSADSGEGSLRNAVERARLHAGSDVIVFAGELSGQILTLENVILVEDSDGVVIDASMIAGGITISGNDSTQLFSNLTGSSLTIRSMNLVHGYHQHAGGAIGSDGTLILENCRLADNAAYYAGAINHNQGVLIMEDCELVGNSAMEGGAGALSLGGFGVSEIELIRCKFLENSAHFSAGAVYIGGNSTVQIVQCVLSRNSSNTGFSAGALYNDRAEVSLADCTFSENLADGSGGAIVNDVGAMTVVRCTFTENAAEGAGGAILNASATFLLSMTHCTFDRNSAAYGGGAILSSGSASLVHCTVSGNSAATGGGVYNDHFSELRLINSIVAGNIADVGKGQDLYNEANTIAGEGANLIGNNETVAVLMPEGFPNDKGDYVGSVERPLDPVLAQLENNGGLTRTRALLSSSPARNRGVVLSPALVVDQRGRPIVFLPDIGAFENQFGIASHPVLIPFGGSFTSELSLGKR